MNKLNLLKTIFSIFGKILKKTYKYQDDTYGDFKYAYFFFYQRILLFNFWIPWPVHFTSYIVNPQKIKFGKKCSPGSSPFQYIEGMNGIEMGDNVQLAPGVHIISANHDHYNYDKLLKTTPIKIGNNTWVGANSVILPGVVIGDNVTIGAGSIVTKSIPTNAIAVGNPCKVIKYK